MCNLYRIKSANEEIARLFGVENAVGNAAEEVYPGYSGLVVAEGRLRSMVWGFPLPQISKRTGEPLRPRPVNNVRSDKLHSFMWRYSFEERRCLIPTTAWAEAEGPRGAMTRTWLSLPDRPDGYVRRPYRWIDYSGSSGCETTVLSPQVEIVFVPCSHHRRRILARIFG